MRKLRVKICHYVMGAIGVCLLSAALPGAAWCAARPLGKRQILGLLQGGVASQRIARVVKIRGIGFTPTAAFFRALTRDGAQPVLIEAIRNAPRRRRREVAARVPTPAAPPLSSEALQYAEQYAAAQQSFEEGKQLLQQRRWPEAESDMRKTVNLDPMNIEAHFDLGYALSQEGRLREATGEYRRVLQLDPDSGAVHYDLAAALEKENDLSGAITQYRSAARLNPNDERPVYALGLALYKIGDWSGAVAAFEASLHLAPSDPDAHCALGLAQLHQHRLRDAIPELHEAVRLDPRNALAHAGLAGALLRQGFRQAALKEFQVAMALNPTNSGYREDFERLWHQIYPRSASREATP